MTPRDTYRQPGGRAMNDDVQINIRPKPTTEHPLRALITVPPTAHALWCTPEDAHLWLDHPGHMPAMARAYIEWAREAANER